MGLLDSIFGGGGSSSSSSATSQQVGAQGNQGPVFGAITTRGGNITQQPRTQGGNITGTAAARKKFPYQVGTVANTANSSGGKNLPSAAASTAGPATADAGGGSGNVNISVVSGDIAASNMSQEVSAYSIAAQSDLASKSINAQSDLAARALGYNTQLASQVLEAGQNFAALSFGAQAASQVIGAVSGSGAGGGVDYVPDQGDGTGAESQTGNKLDGKTLAIVAAIGVVLVLAIKN